MMNENTARFARACYEDNTPEELAHALQTGPDSLDQFQWNLTDEEWRIAVSHALAAHHTGDLDFI
jgi:hypothetical protein